MERERGNLARYFSPNVVEELSGHDEPLKQVRTQNVAVLFVDIVGFTAFANARTPDEVVRTLREFHALMEQEVFRHSGTLDKISATGLWRPSARRSSDRLTPLTRYAVRRR